MQAADMRGTEMLSDWRKYNKEKRNPEAADYVNSVLNANANKNFVKRIQNPSQYSTVDMPDGSVGTHYMSSADVDGKHITFPLIIQNKEGELSRFEDWREAADYAVRNNEYIEFRTPEEAEWFGRNYKEVWKK